MRSIRVPAIATIGPAASWARGRCRRSFCWVSRRSDGLSRLHRARAGFLMEGLAEASPPDRSEQLGHRRAAAFGCGLAHVEARHRFVADGVDFLRTETV